MDKVHLAAVIFNHFFISIEKSEQRCDQNYIEEKNLWLESYHFHVTRCTYMFPNFRFFFKLEKSEELVQINPNMHVT